jgi:hypothetical protein
MQLSLPLAFLDSAVVEEIPIARWRELFSAIGWPASLQSKIDSFGHDDVLAAFQSDEPSDGLLQALEAIHELGTESGRGAIEAAMSDRKVPIGALPKELGEREYALTLFVQQRNDASLADVFSRAQVSVQEHSEQRRYNEFQGCKPRQIELLPQKAAALEKRVAEYCKQSDLGEHVQVQACKDDDVVLFRIVHSHRTRKPLAVVPGRESARTTIQFRPVHSDLLRYESSLGRLRMAVRTAAMVEFYRETLGKVLFDDPSFFDGRPVCSLRVLQDKGRTALYDHNVVGVGRIRMTECLWERGDRNLLHIRDVDCFQSIEELRLPLSEGTLLQAKLKIEIIGPSMRPVTVCIRVPSRIEVSQKRHEILVDRVLDSIGIRNRPPTDTQDDIWALYPWKHPMAVWRTLFGRDADGLVERGALRAVRLESTAHPQHREAGRALSAHAIGGGEVYGISQLEEIPSQSLSATDLDGFELDPEQFGKALRSTLGINATHPLWDRGSLLDLGKVQVGANQLHLFYAIREPQAAIGDQVRRSVAGGSTVVVLIPAARIIASDMVLVRLPVAIPKRQEVLRDALVASCLEASTPAIFLAPDGARLVVDSRLKKIWVDGIEIDTLKPDSQPFRFVELMARSSQPVSSHEISATLSPARGDENTPARQAKRDAKTAISQALTAAGKSWSEDPFPSCGTGFYRCALPSFVSSQPQ